MAINEFPVGQNLLGVSTIQNLEFDSDELCLDEVKFYFEDSDHKITIVTLLPIVDTDEIDITIEEITQEKLSFDASPSVGNNQLLYSLVINSKLMAVWVCENDQGYQDQIIFAFASLHPTIGFVVEGSVIKVFIYQQMNKQLEPHFNHISALNSAAKEIGVLMSLEKIKTNANFLDFIPKYTLKNISNEHREVLEMADIEPITVTSLEQSEPSHVIMSVEFYSSLIDTLKNLSTQGQSQKTVT